MANPTERNVNPKTQVPTTNLGHPPQLYTFPRSAAVIFSARSSRILSLPSGPSPIWPSYPYIGWPPSTDHREGPDQSWSREPTCPAPVGELSRRILGVRLLNTPVKSFTCNTYKSPRKCCRQRTYAPG